MIYIEFQNQFILLLNKGQQCFKVESFFYSHIDNALNLIESYTRLAKMPKTIEEKQN